jgi:segregation and condensation protein B
VTPPNEHGADLPPDEELPRTDEVTPTDELTQADELAAADETAQPDELAPADETVPVDEAVQPDEAGQRGGSSLADGVSAVDPARPVPDPDLTTSAVVQGLEAVLFLAEEPVTVEDLAALVEREPDEVTALLEELAADYRRQERGLEVRSVAGGWRMYTSPVARPLLERWALAGRTGRLTQAALETLAVVAYKQPIGRQEISDIRGVSADGAVRSLVARGLVAEVGRDPGPGQAVLYGTTTTFLERLGLGSVDELPDLTGFLPEAPAPDEPELGALKEVRKRLAAGDELPSRSLGGRSAEQTNTGSGDPLDDADDDDLLPPPNAATGSGREDDAMVSLTDRLEVAARNAVDRLRAAVEAGDGTDDGGDGPDGTGDDSDDGGDGPDGTGDGTDDGGDGPDGTGDGSDAARAEAGDPDDATDAPRSGEHADGPSPSADPDDAAGGDEGGERDPAPAIAASDMTPPHPPTEGRTDG